MKQENKDLLLRYLSMALPYGVKVLHEGWNYEWDDTLYTTERIVGIDEEFIYTKVIDTANGEEYREDKHSIDIFDDKPYLRPMSSMTEEEDKQRIQLGIWRSSQTNGHEVTGIKPDISQSYNSQSFQKALDFLLGEHFDIFGLIPKGLAIEVTEENNPYNITEE